MWHSVGPRLAWAWGPQDFKHTELKPDRSKHAWAYPFCWPSQIIHASGFGPRNMPRLQRKIMRILRLCLAEAFQALYSVAFPPNLCWGNDEIKMSAKTADLPGACLASWVVLLMLASLQRELSAFAVSWIYHDFCCEKVTSMLSGKRANVRYLVWTRSNIFAGRTEVLIGTF